MPVRTEDEFFAIPAAEREVTDEMIFESLDESCAGVAPALRAYRQGHMEEAKRLLLQYFRERRNPRWYFDGRGASGALDTSAYRFVFGDTLRSDDAFDKSVMAHADELVRHRFPGVISFDMGERLDRFPFYDARQGERGGDLHKPLRVTSNRFTRMDFLMTLAIAHDRTGDARYGAAFGRLLDAYMNKYIEQYPYVAEFGESKEAYWFHFQKTPIRTNLCVARSVFVLIGLMHTELFHDERCVDSRLAFRTFRFLWYLMMYHRNYAGSRYRPFNHHLYERGVLPFVIGTMFPEFPPLGDMQEWGKRVIREHIERDFHPSGGYDEHSLQYTCDTTISSMLTSACVLAARNGVELLDERASGMMRRTFAFYSALVLPDGTFPDIGDGGGGEARKFLEYGRDWFGSREAGAVLEALDGPIRHGDRLPPLHLNDPLSGYAAARDGWDRGCSGFVLSNKNFTRHCGHNHLDMLSLVIWANGEKWIGEPLALPLYKFVGNDTPYNDVLRGTAGHNTVQIHGRPLTKKALFESGRNEKQHVETTAFEAGDGRVYLSAYHEAVPDVRHTREVFFVHRAGWIVADTVEGAAAGGPAHIQRWHFERGVEAESLDRAAFLLTGKQGFLLCVWPDREDLSVRLYKDESVREIEHANLGPEPGGLPWIADVRFSGGRLPCMFIPLKTRDGTPLERCRKILERWSERTPQDRDKEGEALYGALHG